LNKKRAVIPEASFTKPPSAELRPNQTDQDSLPPYETLDPIIEAYVEEGKDVDEIVALGYSKTMVEKILDTIDRNEYKRRQAAPGLRITAKAFGRRMPIARGDFRA
jgi:NH3-dependent NAD+ synthetase